MSDYFDKTQDGGTLFRNLNALEGRVKEIEENGTPGSSAASGVTYDIPETLGEYYCIRKALDAAATSAYITSNMQALNGGGTTRIYVNGDTFVGIPYSSTKKYNTFVPNHVSFETYFTALSDPNSYAYKVKAMNGFSSVNSTSAYLYYGSVCTEFACYCLGIKPIIHLNWELFDIPGMELVSIQDAQSAHIGDLINVEGKADSGGTLHYHVQVVIGVKRLNGVVTHIRLADETGSAPAVAGGAANTRIREVTASEFNELLTHYTLIRYSKLEENTYEPWLTPHKMPFFNRNIMPAKGNKANWLNNENIVINVLNAGSYTDYIVYRDGEQYSTAAFSGATINLGVMPYGKYSMVLTDGTNKSAPVEWIVVDMQMSVTPMSGGILRFAWISKNAVPVACCWSRTLDAIMFPTFEIDKEDIVKGYKDTKLSTTPCLVADDPSYSERRTQAELYTKYYTSNGSKIRPRMLFETEFGIITTDWDSTSNVTLLS